MPVVCLGLSHHTAPAEVRERHAFPAARVAEALIALRDYEAVREAALISTCNRLEIYAELEDEARGVLQLKEFLGNFRHSGIAYDIDPYLYVLHGSAAIEHLFRVSTGLDSMLIGDAEVLGQVKDAYRQARRARSLGKTLHRVFHEALNAGKAARSQTAIGTESVSVATAAIAMAKQHVGSLQGKNVLVIGAGKMGQTAAKRLKLEGAAELLVANRTHERARSLVRSLGVGQAIELDSLVDALKLADVVITSTGASHFVITPGKVAEAMISRPGRPIFLIDVAVPRDVDPAVARIPGVGLVDIDKMGESIDLTIEHRRAAIPRVEAIVQEHLNEFDDWYRSRATIPVISSLSRKAESIRNAEVERLVARCPGLSDRDRALIAGMSLTIVSRLLHSVIVKIRDHAEAPEAELRAKAQMVDELFELHLDESESQTEYWLPVAEPATTADFDLT